MAVDFGATNTDRHYTTPDSNLLDLPAGDWAYIIIFKPRETTTQHYYISHGGANTAANSVQAFNNSTETNGFSTKLNNTTTQIWGGGQLTLNQWYVGYAARRANTFFAGCGALGNPNVLSESAGVAQTGIHTPSGLFKVGMRSDLTSSSTQSMRGTISDVILVKNIAFNKDDARHIMLGNPMNTARWWKYRVMHLYLSTSAHSFLVDLTGKFAFTRLGTGFTTGALERNSDQRVITKINGTPEVLLAPAVANPLAVFHNHYVNQGIV